MWRRKKKNNSLVYIVSFVIVFILWLFYYSWYFQQKIVKIPQSILTWIQLTWNNSKDIEKEKNYYANSNISGTWELIVIPYDIKNGTKFKLNYDNNSFLVKSDIYALDNYVWENISFSWEVIWFTSDNKPVLNILFIEGDKSENITWDEQKNDKLFTLDTLYLNLEDTDYLVKTWVDELLVYETWDVNLFKIDSFKCKEWDYLYDCKALKQQAKTFKFKKIISDEWVVFYSLPETEQYMVLGTEYWYNIYPLSWDIYTLISYITVKDKLENQWDKTNLQEVIKSTCKNNKIWLTKIIKITKDNDIYIVNGYDKYSNNVFCKLKIVKDLPLVLKLLEINLVSESKSNKNYTWDVVLNKDIDETKYLIYKSRAYGFTLYMPKSVKYKSILIKNNLWLAWLNCLQQINIADWKNWNLETPELKFLYCKTNLSNETISSFLETKYSNFKIIDSNSKKFIVILNWNEKSNSILKDLLIY